MVNFFEMTGGSAYVVTRQFSDVDHNEVPVGARLTYQTKIFDPANGCYLVFFKERKLRLHEQTSKHLIENLHEYLAVGGAVPADAYSAELTKHQDDAGPVHARPWKDMPIRTGLPASIEKPTRPQDRMMLLLLGVAFFLLGLGTLVTGVWLDGRPPVVGAARTISGPLATMWSLLSLFAGACLVYFAIRQNRSTPRRESEEEEALKKTIAIYEKHGLQAQADEARDKLIKLVGKSGL